MPKVSVFIPVYNAEKYLRQCVDSVLNQTYTDFELIICNDCSTDNSLLICQEYTRKDRRVRLVNNEKNLGLYNTRLKCLEYVEGEYFFQVDADDWIDKDCIKTMIAKAIELNVDVVTVGFMRTLDKWGLFSNKGQRFEPGLYAEDALKDYHHIFIQRVFANNVWSKLIKMSVIKSATFHPTDIHFGEDILFIQTLSPYINSIFVSPKYMYYYRYGGSTANVNPKFWTDQCKLYWIRKEYAHEYEPEYVKGLTLFLLDTLKSVLWSKTIFVSPSQIESNLSVELNNFYTSKEYQEIIKLDDDDDKYIPLLRSKDTQTIIKRIKHLKPSLMVYKAKSMSLIYRKIVGFYDFFALHKNETSLSLQKRPDHQIKLVSVFVPVYNAEKYLRQCVDSILGQTYSNLEVILFNDASKDGSLRICREYEAKDKRVRVIDSQKNVGVYNGRLCAVKEFHGDYFTQIDSDDWVSSDYIETAVSCAEENQVDIVAMGFYRTFDRKGWLKQAERRYGQRLYSTDDLKQYHGILTERIFSNNISTKLIRKEVFGNREFPSYDIHYGDDLLFIQQFSDNIHSVYSLPVCKYYYVFGGSTTTFNPRVWTDQRQLYWLRKSYALEHEPEYVPGLTLFFIDIFKDVLKFRLCINNSKDRENETRSFLEDFYDTDDYKEMIAVDTSDEFVHLLRKRDTEGILNYVKGRTSRLAVFKTRALATVFKLLSKI